ncbi:MAG: 50S ribosomal protein L9 [Candidatus Omnitrophica bacterium]|nr:50S ribosomal protein L9 [Candidatus Omnitrophota bacterium]
MKVVLLQDVDRLGKTGERLTVKDGYGRNYLLPRGLAVSASRGASAQAQAAAAARLRAVQMQKEKAEGLAVRLNQVSCQIQAAVGEQGKLHGSVTAADIARSLAAQGLSVEKQQIELERPLTHLGPAEIQIRLHPEVRAIVRVSIVPK